MTRRPANERTWWWIRIISLRHCPWCGGGLRVRADRGRRKHAAEGHQRLPQPERTGRGKGRRGARAPEGGRGRGRRVRRSRRGRGRGAGDRDARAIAAPARGRAPPARARTADGASTTRRGGRAARVNGEGGWHRTATGVARRTLEAAYEDNIPFLASAVSFDILLTAIPFVGLVLAVVAYLVEYQLAIHQLNVHELLQRFLPESSGGENGQFGFIERALGDLVARRGHLTLLAAPLFLWFSTRMFGGLRAALNEVFDTEENRPWPVAKLMDLAMVFVAGALFLANAFASTAGGVTGQFMPLIFSTLLFYVIFKFLPSRRIYWRTGLVASLFCAIAFEIAKRLYALYVARFVTFDRVASDANLVAFLLFILWIYYTAYVFLLGGEVAETYDLMRMRRLQRVRLG